MWSFAEAGENICGVWENLPCLPCRLPALFAKCWYSVTSSKSMEERESKCMNSQIFWNIMYWKPSEIFFHTKTYPLFFSNPNCWNVGTAKTTTSVCMQQMVTSLQPFATVWWTWSSILQFYANVIMRRQTRESYFDVVVLAVATFQQLGLETLWKGFGRNKDFRWLPIHDNLEDLGIHAVGFPFFHAFTGCDTVSAFRRNGKKSAWQTSWEVFPDATDVFTRLNKRPHSLLETDMEIKEEFVCIMYDRGTDTFAVNKAKLELFARKQRSYEAIPTTLDA